MARSLFSARGALLKCHATGEPAHDRIATAPNFLQARGRLTRWVERWIIDPQAISQGTSRFGLFTREKRGHWVFYGPTRPRSGYDRTKPKLLVDYILQLTQEEQRRVGLAMESLVRRRPRPAAHRRREKRALLVAVRPNKFSTL